MKQYERNLQRKLFTNYGLYASYSKSISVKYFDQARRSTSKHFKEHVAQLKQQRP